MTADVREMPERQPWDAGDPADALAESCRLQVLNISLNNLKAAIYRDMPPALRLQSEIAGILTGLVGVVYSVVPPKDRKEVLNIVRDYLPQARMNVEDSLAQPEDQPHG